MLRAIKTKSSLTNTQRRRSLLEGPDRLKLARMRSCLLEAGHLVVPMQRSAFKDKAIITKANERTRITIADLPSKV